jgi:hypothetical protein
MERIADQIVEQDERYIRMSSGALLIKNDKRKGLFRTIKKHHYRVQVLEAKIEELENRLGILERKFDDSRV